MTRFPMMAALALPLLASAGAAETPPARERFGDFTYDAATYAVDGGDGSYVVRDRDAEADHQPMTVTIHDGPLSDCTSDKLAIDARAHRGDRGDLNVHTIARAGFDIHIARWYWGCRNARPPSVMACTAFHGRVYRFLALSIGCRGGPGFSGGPEGFLGSLAPVP